MKDKRGAPTQRFSVGDRVLSFVRYNVHQLCCFKALGKAVKGVSVLYACREINTRLDCRLFLIYNFVKERRKLSALSAYMANIRGLGMKSPKQSRC